MRELLSYMWSKQQQNGAESEVAGPGCRATVKVREGQQTTSFFEGRTRALRAAVASTAS